MADGFLIGEQFLGRIRSAVDSHEGYIRKEEPYRVGSRLEGDVASSGFRGIYTIKARIAKATLDAELAGWPAHLGLPADEKKLQIKLQEGHAIGIDAFDFQGGQAGQPHTLGKKPESADAAGLVPELNDLPVLSARISARYVSVTGMGLGAEGFGVVSSITYDADKESEEDDLYYEAKVIVGGVFVCRAIAFAPGDRLVAPPPVPAEGDLRNRWYPYPLMAPAGPARVLATGAYYRTGPNQWPRVYEVLARL